MSVTTFIMLLAAFSIITSLVTEAIKKILDSPKPNIVALIVGLIIGVGGSIVYYILNAVPIDVVTVIYAILLGGASALCAMLGYDKVKQAIEQIISKE